MKIYKYIMGIMGFGYLFYWISAICGLITIEVANSNEFAYEWSFGLIDPLIAILYIVSVAMYLKNRSWKIIATISLAMSFVINLQTIIYWIILSNFTSPMWLMALFVLFYSLVGIIIINKE